MSTFSSRTRPNEEHNVVVVFDPNSQPAERLGVVGEEVTFPYGGV